jgi:NAD-dependent dihydropyrimidine dehydrogenase PreA subunit
MPPKINKKECAGCGACIDICPNNVLELVDGVAKVMNPTACIDCWACVDTCPLGIISQGKTKRKI